MSGTGRKRGTRAVSPEERKLWNQVASSTLPLANAARETPSASETTGPEQPKIPVRQPSAPSFSESLRPSSRNGAPVTARLLDPEVGPVGRPEAGLDRRTAERLRKGTKEPEARIDLHGMTAERAHRVCLTFLGDAMSRGLRVVLVITGKGRRDEHDIMRSGRGVLRESLPGWLRASPLGGSIVGIYQAHQKHGGAGAFYVYLKRRR